MHALNIESLLQGCWRWPGEQLWSAITPQLLWGSIRWPDCPLRMASRQSNVSQQLTVVSEAAGTAGIKAHVSSKLAPAHVSQPLRNTF